MASIRRRLLGHLLIGIGLLLVAAGAAVYGEIADEVDELYDAQLQQAAYAFPRITVAATPAAHGEADEDRDTPLHRLVVEVRDRDRAQPIYLSRARALLPADAATGWSTIRVDGERWRLYTADFADRRVQVAQPLAVRRQATLEIAERLLLPLAAALPLAGLLIWFGVGRGLRPLVRLSAELHARSPQALTPLAMPDLPAELQPVTDALNALLERLQRTLEAQRRFIADAAHELLTPLTALRLQQQLLARATRTDERQAAAAELAAGVERAIHLAGQLLALARQTAEVREPVRRPVELAALAREAGRRLQRHLEARQQTLSLDLQPATVDGDPAALTRLIENLLDNAIKYTPLAGTIRLQLRAAGDGAELTLNDSGPGIPVDQRQRVFDRFYRIPGSDATGSGLGLAIVREIAAAHGAAIELESPGALGGLTVRLRFPGHAPGRSAH